LRLALTVRPAVPPGTRWEYNDYHPLLLGMILERTTARYVADYLSDKIGQPARMEAPASWSLDSRHDAFDKKESAINARVVDFARFGRLMLNGEHDDVVWEAMPGDQTQRFGLACQPHPAQRETIRPR
jgi:CubicO group peptidase (beta-lactamase class C family)